MVAIKIQSLDDIVKAYLQNLGFEGKRLDSAVGMLLMRLGNDYNADNVLSSLDELIYKSAQQIFEKNKLAKEQKIAMFKLCFLLNDGAQKWDVQVLLGDKIDNKIATLMQEKILQVAPPYKFSVMKPQVIETVDLGEVIEKIMKTSKKA